MPDRQDDTTGAWDELTEDLVDLTGRLRAAYHRVSDESGPSEDEIRHAVRTLGAAWSQVAPSLGEVIRDEEVKAHLKRAASSLADAVGATLSELIPRSGPGPGQGKEEDPA